MATTEMTLEEACGGQYSVKKPGRISYFLAKYLGFETPGYRKYTVGKIETSCEDFERRLEKLTLGTV